MFILEEFCKRIPACPPDQNEPHAITTVEVFCCYHYEKVPSLLSWPCKISLEIHNTTETDQLLQPRTSCSGSWPVKFLFFPKQLLQNIHTAPKILTFIPSNLDKARRGLSALSVLRDFRALPWEQSNLSWETDFSPQETNESCVNWIETEIIDWHKINKLFYLCQ